MVMDPDALFRGRYTIFHSQQYIGSHVQEHGHAERSACIIYQHALSSMGDQTAVEPVRGHHQDQEMVDHHHAGAHVGRYASPSFPA